MCVAEKCAHDKELGFCGCLPNLNRVKMRAHLWRLACAYYLLDLDNLERIWTTSLFRLRSISSVPLSMQSGHILKSCINPSWKTNLHGYTALTISPQQSQNKWFMFSSYTHMNWGITNLKKKVSCAKIVANLKCLRRQIYCDLRNKQACARITMLIAKTLGEGM